MNLTTLASPIGATHTQDGGVTASKNMRRATVEATP